MTAPTILSSVEELRTQLPNGFRLLGLDIGQKTIGLAISDPNLMIASPLKTLTRGRKLKPVIDDIRQLIGPEKVGGLIAGLPIEMDGREGPKCQSVRDVTAELSRQLALPATFWDERLSTSAVEKFLIGEADMTRQRRGEVVDKMAAAFILQGAIDSVTR